MKKKFRKNTNEISAKENKTRQAKNNLIPGSINQKNNAVGNAAVKKNINKNSSQHYKLSAAKKNNKNKFRRKGYDSIF